jgi:hypothetical protein
MPRKPKKFNLTKDGISRDNLHAALTAEQDKLVETIDGDTDAPVNIVTKTLRVQHVATWLLDGLGTAEVIRRGVERWGISERTVKRYLSAARAQIEAVSAQELRGAATLALYRLTELYFAAVQSGDLRTALDVVKAQNRMLGLNAPEKFETKTVTDWNSLSIAEQLTHVADILERSKAARKEVN